MVTTTSMGLLVVVALGQASVSVEVIITGPGVEFKPVNSGHGSVSVEVIITGPGVDFKPVDSGQGSVKVLVTATERVAEVNFVTGVDSAILVTVLLGSEKVT